MRARFSPQQVVWLVGFGTALSLPGDSTLYIALPTHTVQAGIALEDVGLMLAANRLVRVFLNGPYGYWLDRVRRRPVLVFSLFLGALATLTYTAPGFWPLLVGRLMWGIAWVGIWVGGSTVVMDVSTDANRGAFTGQYQMWFFLGAAGSSLVAGVLTDALGYGRGLLVSAGITLVAAFVWLALLPETRDFHNARPGVAVTQSPARAVARQEERPNGFSVRGLATASAVYGVQRLVYAGVLAAILALLLEERLGAVFAFGVVIPLTTLTGGLSALRLMLSTAASPLAGRLSDRRGDRLWLSGVALAFGAAALAWLALADGVGFVVAVMLTAVATGALSTLSTALAGDSAPAGGQGQAMGALNTVGDLGSAVGPLMAFALLPAIGLHGVLALCAALMVALIPWVAFVARATRARATRAPARLPLAVEQDGDE